MELYQHELRWKDQLQLISNLWVISKSRDGWGNVVFSLVRFVQLSSPPVDRNARLKNRPWRKYDLKLIGVIYYPTSSGKNLIHADAIDYQFVSQKLFRNIFSELIREQGALGREVSCFREFSILYSLSHTIVSFNKYRVSGQCNMS